MMSLNDYHNDSLAEDTDLILLPDTYTSPGDLNRTKEYVFVLSIRVRTLIWTLLPTLSLYNCILSLLVPLPHLHNQFVCWESNNLCFLAAQFSHFTTPATLIKGTQDALPWLIYHACFTLYVPGRVPDVPDECMAVCICNLKHPQRAQQNLTICLFPPLFCMFV